MTETVRPDPSRPFRWVVLVFISLTMFGNYYVYDCIAPVADLLAKQLGFSDSNIGLLQAIYSIPNVVMVLIGGYVVDRIGTRKAISSVAPRGRGAFVDRSSPLRETLMASVVCSAMSVEKSAIR